MPESAETREILRKLAEYLPENVLKDVVPHVAPETVRQLLHRLAGEAPRKDKPSQKQLFPQSKTQQSADACKLYTDGAARGNPGEAGAGAVLLGPDGEEIGTRSLYLGQCTNNVAEYYALLAGLKLALQHGCGKLHICLDSELIVRQIQGVYKVKNAHLKPLFEEVKSLLAKLGAWEITHVPRAENSRADELANKGIDEQKELGVGA